MFGAKPSVATVALSLAAVFAACGSNPPTGVDETDDPPAPELSCASGFVPLDFEGGPGSIGIGGWNNGGVPQVEASIAGPGDGSNWAAVVELTGNDGSGPGGWSGGGMTIPLSSQIPIDISGCTSLSFAVRVLPGSELFATTFKLEDAGGSNTHERALSEFVNVSSDWATVTVPLSSFQGRADDPEFRRAVDLTQVTLLVTVSVHDDNTDNGDGSLAMDDIVLN